MLKQRNTSSNMSNMVIYKDRDKQKNKNIWIKKNFKKLKTCI